MRHLICLSLLILPVAARPDDKPAEDPHKLQPDHAPTPYTADEIRAACPEGRVNVFRVEAKGQVQTLTFKFLKCDEKGAEIETSSVMEDGTPGGSNKRTSTWKELQAHGSYPEKDTKVTEETVEVPAGKFECKVYAVTQNTGGKQVKRTMYFDKAVAGPPVKFVQEVDGQAVMTMALVELKQPEKKEEQKPADGETPKGS
jgi:hypothetical protein